MRRARLVVLGLTAALSAGVANADTFVPLPGARIVRTLGDGTVVTVSLEDESAKILRPMGATPMHREFWASGRGIADITGPAAKDPDLNGRVRPGYVIGCQVSLDGVTGGDVGAQALPNSQGTYTITPNGTGGPTATLVLAPGQASSFYMLDLEILDDFGNERHNNFNKFRGPHGSVEWDDERFDILGCAGYAQARSFVQIQVSTETADGVMTIWGKPFSIG